MRTTADPSAGRAGQRRRCPDTAEPPHRSAASQRCRLGAQPRAGQDGARQSGNTVVWLRQVALAPEGTRFRPDPAACRDQRLDHLQWKPLHGKALLPNHLRQKDLPPNHLRPKQPHRLRRIGENHKPHHSSRGKQITSLQRHEQTHLFRPFHEITGVRLCLAPFFAPVGTIHARQLSRHEKYFSRLSFHRSACKPTSTHVQEAQPATRVKPAA